MVDLDPSDQLRAETRAAWHRYLDLVGPFRADLYRYCRRLTGNVWDAEDLLQDTLMRGFATLASVHSPVENPRGYLVRIASNLWIDRTRRATLQLAHAERMPAPGSSGPTTSRAETGEAASRLWELLAPQERAALVMKEVFDLSLQEIASMLGTTPGAVKAALHRGRGRLREPEPSPRRSTPPRGRWSASSLG